MPAIVRLQVAGFVAVCQLVGAVLVALIAGLLPGLSSLQKVFVAAGLLGGAYGAARFAPKIWQAASVCSAAAIGASAPIGFGLAVACISLLKNEGLLRPDEFIEAGIVIFGSFLFALVGTLWCRQPKP